MLNNSYSIVLTIDGIKKGLLGNLTRQFSLKYPDFWKEIESSIQFPLPLSDVFLFNSNYEYSNKVVLVVATLNHLQNLDASSIESVCYNAYCKILDLLIRKKIDSVALTLLIGGGRLNSLNAFVLLSNALETRMDKIFKLDINLYFNDKNEYLKICSFAKNIGW